ncbi:MAG: ABC transporter permease [Verrucomicrobiota bacterium]
MSMLRVLLIKDLRRAWRNPWPWLINLILPLCMTALIGLVFGGRSEDSGLGRIRFAVVDEDDSALTQMLRGAAGQRDAGKYLEPVYMDRAAAMREIEANRISGALVIPAHFTRDYLAGSAPVTLELIKNPAQSIHPAVLDELLGVVATALNAVARNFQSELPEWLDVAEGRADYRKVSQLIERAGDRFQAARQFLSPPRVAYEKEVSDATPAGAGPAFSLFGYLLAGMGGMFLLFLGGNGMADLHREVQRHTLERYHTLQENLLPFIAGKMLFTTVLLLLCSAILFGGGSIVFHIHWVSAGSLSVLLGAYAVFVAGLMALLVAIVPDERRGAVLNNIAGMFLGFAGGCAFPPDQLPAFFRLHVTPFLPTNWFVGAARSLIPGGPEPHWQRIAVQLAGLGIVLGFLAVAVLRRRFHRGIRS